MSVYVIPGGKVAHLFEECVPLTSRERLVMVDSGDFRVCQRCAIRQRNEARERMRASGREIRRLLALARNEAAT